MTKLSVMSLRKIFRFQIKCSNYHDGCQEDCHNIKFRNTNKILFTRINILNKYFVTIARFFSLVSVNETSVLKLKF